MSSEITPESEQDLLLTQLHAAERGGSAGAVISQSANRAAGAFASAIGILIAAMLLAVVYVFPTNNPWLIALCTAAYGVGIATAVLSYSRRRQASNVGWNSYYLVGLTVSLVLYSAGIILLGNADLSKIWFWPLYAVATALPLIVAGRLRAPQ